MKTKNLTLDRKNFYDFFIKERRKVIIKKREYEIFMSPNPILVTKTNKLCIGFCAVDIKNDKATNEIYIPIIKIAKSKPETILAEIKKELIKINK